MDILENLNDDQTALLGCGVALLLCGSAMVISHTLRQWVSGTRARREADVTKIDPRPANAESTATDRKAA